MIRNRFTHLSFAVLAAYGALGCESGGVGDPCIPEDEYKQGFNGFALQEVNVESRSFQCETRVCIVNHFQGRVSCPYGQADPLGSGLGPEDPARCRVPGTDGTLCVNGTSGTKEACNNNGTPDPTDDNNIDQIEVPVEPQYIFRSAEDTVYCSCRCKGPDPAASYCECPSGYVCEELVRDLGLEREQLVGSYCIKPGTKYDPTRPPQADFCKITDDPKKEVIGPKGKKRTVGSVCGSADGKAANPPI